MRIHAISPEFWGFQILSAYVCITLHHSANGKAGLANWLTILIISIECAHCSSEMSSLASVVDFDQTASYILERLKTPEIKLKPEKVKAIKHIYRGKDVFASFPTELGKSICYLLCSTIVKAGRC